MQTAKRRQAAQEDALINQQLAEARHVRKQQAKAADKEGSAQDLENEAGFWNLGATSHRVRFYTCLSNLQQPAWNAHVNKLA